MSASTRNGIAVVFVLVCLLGVTAAAPAAARPPGPDPDSETWTGRRAALTARSSGARRGRRG